jgi:phosphatidylglycerophosphate synthase
MASGAPQTQPDSPRRPLKTRSRPWARALARRLTSSGISPNAISVASVAFAILASLGLWYTSRIQGWTRSVLYLAAAAGIQLRLLCNMMDGMVAIEGNRKTPYGDIFNDMPDRLADVVILVAAGYSMPEPSWGRALGWLAAVLAVMTAYVRLLGGSLGVPQYFRGPMAKQHRMAVMTAACVISGAVPNEGQVSIIGLALIIIIVGSLLTVIRRTLCIARDLKRR